MTTVATGVTVVPDDAGTEAATAVVVVVLDEDVVAAEATLEAAPFMAPLTALTTAAVMEVVPLESEAVVAGTSGMASCSGTLHINVNSL